MAPEGLGAYLRIRWNKSKIKEMLKEQGLSDEEITELEPYINQAAKGGLVGAPRVVEYGILAALGLVGLVLIYLGIQVGGITIIFVLIFAALCWGLGYYGYRGISRKEEIMDVFRSDPYILLEKGDDALSFNVISETPIQQKITLSNNYFITDENKQQTTTEERSRRSRRDDYTSDTSTPDDHSTSDEPATTQEYRTPDEDQATAENGEAIYCHQCGTRMDTEARYCPDCGTSLAQKAEQSVEVDTPSLGEVANATADTLRREPTILVPWFLLLVVSLPLLLVEPRQLQSGLGLVYSLVFLGLTIATWGSTFLTVETDYSMLTNYIIALKRIPWFIGLTLVWSILVTIGFILFILPGIFLLLKFALAPPAVFVDGYGPLGSLKQSWKTTSGNYLIILVIFAVLITSGVIGAAANATGQIVGILSSLIQLIIAASVAFSLSYVYVDSRHRGDLGATTQSRGPGPRNTDAETVSAESDVGRSYAQSQQSDLDQQTAVSTESTATAEIVDGGTSYRTQVGHRTASTWQRGVFGGIGAFVAGYGVFYLLKTNAVTRSFREGAQQAMAIQILESAGVSIPPVWKLVGWAYYAAHNANLAHTLPEGIAPGKDTIQAQPDFIFAQDLLFWFVPIVVLFVAGFVIAHSTDATTWYEGARDGAAIVCGYLPVTLVGVFLFEWNVEIGGITFWQRPHLITSLLMVGLVYPYAFGSIGGAVSGMLIRGGGDSAQKVSRDNSGPHCDDEESKNRSGQTNEQPDEGV